MADVNIDPTGLTQADYERNPYRDVNWVPKNIGDMSYKSRQNVGFDAEKYKVDNMAYPEDLMNSPAYGGNYAIFYINVAIDSKLLKDPSVETVEEILPRDRGDLVAQNFSTTGLVTAASLGSAFKGALGGAIAKGSGAIGSGTKSVLSKGASGALLGGAAGAALPVIGFTAVGSLAASATRAQKRLKTAIALHIPNNLSIRYGVNYESEDTSTVAMMGAGSDEISKALSSQGKMSDLSDPAKAIIANIALSKGPNAGAVSAATGLQANPKKEQVFKGVDFRSFQFDYQFFPRNPKEAENVLNIIKTFKYHMHPEFKDANNFLYIYPSEFDIFYYNNGEENLNVHRNTSCVLYEMNINYTPNGQFNTFENGMPTQINVTLAFRELALLTKDKIKDGL
jgi:hypothetical protein